MVKLGYNTVFRITCRHRIILFDAWAFENWSNDRCKHPGNIEHYAALHSPERVGTFADSPHRSKGKLAFSLFIDNLRLFALNTLSPQTIENFTHWDVHDPSVQNSMIFTQSRLIIFLYRKSWRTLWKQTREIRGQQTRITGQSLVSYLFRSRLRNV